MASKLFGVKFGKQLRKLIVEVDDLGAALILAQQAGREEAAELIIVCTECRARLNAMYSAHYATEVTPEVVAQCQ